jgi:hypothetical protein
MHAQYKPCFLLIDDFRSGVSILEFVGPNHYLYHGSFGTGYRCMHCLQFKYMQLSQHHRSNRQDIPCTRQRVIAPTGLWDFYFIYTSNILHRPSSSHHMHVHSFPPFESIIMITVVESGQTITCPHHVCSFPLLN